MTTESEEEQKFVELAERIRSTFPAIQGALGADKHVLDSNDERMLDHFWNPHHEEIHKSVPTEFLFFVEVQRLTGRSGSSAARDVVMASLQKLVWKGYIVPDLAIASGDIRVPMASEIKLTPRAEVYLGAGKLPLFAKVRRMVRDNRDVVTIAGVTAGVTTAALSAIRLAISL